MGKKRKGEKWEGEWVRSVTSVTTITLTGRGLFGRMLDMTKRPS